MEIAVTVTTEARKICIRMCAKIMNRDKHKQTLDRKSPNLFCFFHSIYPQNWQELSTKSLYRVIGLELPFPGFLHTSCRKGWYYSEGTCSYVLPSACFYYHSVTCSREITWVPAACRLLQHPGHPTGHHRWYPTCHHGKPPLALQSSPFPQLNAEGHPHLCFKKGKESTTERDREKAHAAVQGVEPFTSQRSSWDALIPPYHILPSRPHRNMHDCSPQYRVLLVQERLFSWLLRWLELCCLETNTWFDKKGMWSYTTVIFQTVEVCPLLLGIGKGWIIFHRKEDHHLCSRWNKNVLLWFALHSFMTLDFTSYYQHWCKKQGGLPSGGTQVTMALPWLQAPDVASR